MRKAIPTTWVFLLMAGMMTGAPGSEGPEAAPFQPEEIAVLVSGTGDMHHCPSDASDTNEQQDGDHHNDQKQPTCQDHHSQGALLPVFLTQNQRDCPFFALPSSDLHKHVRTGRTISLPVSGRFYGTSPPLLYLIVNVFLL